MTKKDLDKAKKYGNKKFSKDILNVADSLRGAMQAIENGNLENDDKIKPLVEGVSLTNKTLIDTLAKNGITVVKYNIVTLFCVYKRIIVDNLHVCFDWYFVD